MAALFSTVPSYTPSAIPAVSAVPTFPPIPFRPPPPTTIAPAFLSPCDNLRTDSQLCFFNEMSQDDSVACGNCLNSLLIPSAVQAAIDAGCTSAGQFLCTNIWACEFCGKCIDELVALNACEMKQTGLDEACDFGSCPSPPPTFSPTVGDELPTAVSSGSPVAGSTIPTFAPSPPPATSGATTTTSWTFQESVSIGFVAVAAGAGGGLLLLN